MFYALSSAPDYWNTKLNLFVALAPVTALSHTSSDLMVAASKLLTPIHVAANFAHVYSILGPISAIGTKIFCGLIPSFC